MVHWSSGQDATLSRWNQEFDSPMDYHEVEGQFNSWSFYFAYQDTKSLLAYTLCRATMKWKPSQTAGLFYFCLSKHARLSHQHPKHKKHLSGFATSAQ